MEIFGEHLTIIILDMNLDTTTIISDQNKGSAELIDHMPIADFAWYCWHSVQNVRQSLGIAIE